ncbi:mucosa-associated lymphoid tissue lymphoma translocation protein 1 homolog [Octopus vulgaris]|nr:mucosa-associated lymphoid tissue lymphoma translocation protein 1 homolog [Octopus vulgaris]
MENNSNLTLSINKMPMRILSPIERCLEYEQTDDFWPQFVHLVTRINFHISQGTYREIIHKGNRQGNTIVREMLAYLVPKGFTIRDLLFVLNELRLEPHVKAIRDFANIPPEPVRIIDQPKDPGQLKEGDTLQLSIKARGFPYPRYQWFRNDDAIEGANQAELIIPNISTEQEGNYSCRVHNSRRNVLLSTLIPISVFAFKITQFSPSQLLQEGDVLNLWCNATNTCSQLIYNWFKDGQLIATTQDYRKKKTSIHDSGIYWCEVISNQGSISSEKITINVSADTLEIVIQPKFTMVLLNGVALFLCEAKGPAEIHYQWYKDDIILPNENKAELKIHVASESFKGMYYCVVSCLAAIRTSDFAYLQITKSVPDISREVCQATDKIALLIGNEDYRSERKLKATSKDVKLLSGIFQKLGFKVLSLLNLTLTEMKMAVYRFVELLNNGVYGVFYYAGHGFEVSGDPYSYLLPVDAPTGADITVCLSAQKIHQLMLERNPSLCCLILDICRTICQESKYYSSPLQMRPNTSSLYMYSTSRGQSAFEPLNGRMGNFVYVLKDYLYSDDTVEAMFGKVRHAIATNSKVLPKQQNPELYSNLANVNISLSDQINTTNHTQEYNIRSHLWMQAIRLPRTMHVDIKEFGAKLKVEFSSQFSNVMSITVTVVDSGSVPDCYAWIANIPSTLTADKASVLQVDKKKIRIVVKDLQKLQEPMTAVIRFVYTDESGESKCKVENLALDFPLVANLQLWRLSTDLLQMDCIEKKVP